MRIFYKVPRTQFRSKQLIYIAAAFHARRCYRGHSKSASQILSGVKMKAREKLATCESFEPRIRRHRIKMIVILILCICLLGCSLLLRQFARFVFGSARGKKILLQQILNVFRNSNQDHNGGANPVLILQWPDSIAKQFETMNRTWVCYQSRRRQVCCDNPVQIHKDPEDCSAFFASKMILH